MGIPGRAGAGPSGRAALLGRWAAGRGRWLFLGVLAESAGRPLRMSFDPVIMPDSSGRVSKPFPVPQMGFSLF